jgi:hypothetical protein
VTAVETQEMAEFTMLATEAIGSLVALEALHTSDPTFNPSMILFDVVIQVSTGPYGDFREFRVRAGKMEPKEASDVPMESPAYPRCALGPTSGRSGPQDGL